jgi:2-polyprenylphenol 6-hydroxylase
MKETDILISGAGPVGLFFALGLADLPYRVTLVDPVDPREKAVHGSRVLALNLASIQHLAEYDIWEALQASACSYFDMRVYDSQDQCLSFSAQQQGVSSLGAVLPQESLVEVLAKHVFQRLPRLNFQQTRVKRWDAATASCILENGEKIKPEIMVAADGAKSLLRQQLKIRTREYSQTQSACTAILQMTKPHRAMMQQKFFPSGPLGLLPLPDPNQVAMVWSLDTGLAEDLPRLSEAAFQSRLEPHLTFANLGGIKTIGRRSLTALWGQHAEDYVAYPLVLLGDAAHVVHPLAGQGLNLGLMDAYVLAQKICQEDSLSEVVLLEYEAERYRQNKKWIMGIDVVRSLYMDHHACWTALRGVGLGLLQHTAAAKKILVAEALGL